MSHQATTWVLEKSEAEGIDFIVLFVIANHCHPDGSGAFPGMTTIASQARICERRARYAVKNLEKLGELIVHRTKGGVANQEWKSRNDYSIPGVVADGFYTERRPKPAAPHACGMGVSSGTASGIPSGTAVPPNNPLELKGKKEELPRKTGAAFPSPPPGGKSVNPQYLEFVSLRDQHRIPKGMTWTTWRNLSEQQQQQAIALVEGGAPYQENVREIA